MLRARVAVACWRRSGDPDPSDLYPGGDADPLQAALLELGAESVSVWDDLAVMWESISHIAGSSTWDCADRPVEYLRLGPIGLEGLKTDQPGWLLEWNLDKVHQRELESERLGESVSSLRGMFEGHGRTARGFGLFRSSATCIFVGQHNAQAHGQRRSPAGPIQPDPPRPQRNSFRLVPSAVFAYPQVAAVGATERQLRAKSTPCLAATSGYSAAAFGWALEDSSTRAVVDVVDYAPQDIPG